MMDAVRERAKRRVMPYTRFICEAVELVLTHRAYAAPALLRVEEGMQT